MKKILSFIMSIILILSVVPCALASSEESNASPVIFLNGFTGSGLYHNGYRVFPPYIDPIDKEDIISLITPLLFGLITHNYSRLVEKAGEMLPGLLDDVERVKINPDGSSDYDIYVRSQNPQFCQGRIYDDTTYEIASKIGYDNFFLFYDDWRYSIADIAAQLDVFIDGVLELTGADKVSLFGYSHGGQVAAYYMNFYADKNNLDRVVFVNAPVYGTKTVSGALDKKQLDISLYSAVKFSYYVHSMDKDYSKLLSLIDLRFLNDAIYAIADEYLYPVALYWGGAWDMVPMEDYDKFKNDFLDSEEQAWLIEKSDKYHYNVMNRMNEVVKEAQERGVKVSAVSSIGNGLVINDNYDGDSVVDAHGSSGAYALKHGKRFPASYKPIGNVCNDSTHDHISPDRSIDASCCCLPENTWFIIGQAHCQYDYDDYTVELLTRLFTDDSLPDVYADENFPQFHYGTSSKNELYVTFDGNNAGYVPSDSNEISIKNLDYYDRIKIKYITVGSNIITVPSDTIIEPMDTISVPVKFIVKHRQNSAVKIKVHYEKLTFEQSERCCKTLVYTAK